MGCREAWTCAERNYSLPLKSKPKTPVSKAILLTLSSSVRMVALYLQDTKRLSRAWMVMARLPPHVLCIQATPRNGTSRYFCVGKGKKAEIRVVLMGRFHGHTWHVGWGVWIWGGLGFNMSRWSTSSFSSCIDCIRVSNQSGVREFDCVADHHGLGDRWSMSILSDLIDHREWPRNQTKNLSPFYRYAWMRKAGFG